MAHSRSIVTGVAGFIGSHLAGQLIALGHDVVGIDCFTPYYDPTIKRANVAALLASPRFRLVHADLTTADLDPLLVGADYVFHQAAQAGVRASWGESFITYAQHNVLATQRLLEALKGRPIRKLVYASSSSVYGDAPLPMRETACPQPVSPYGVTKLAAEHLCHLYHVNYGLPTVSLRYFTVYGPRQRPDMAIHKFIRAIAAGDTISVYGDGRQSRDFTYVDDIVQANILAAFSGAMGSAINVGGGSRITVRDLLALLQELVCRPAHLSQLGGQKGDVGHTYADCTRAREVLGFVPSVGLEVGLRRQVAWHLAAADERGALAG
jgi:nucleoside-diphosphate-sugar epimerase